jgi:hypothetical protein
LVDEIAIFGCSFSRGVPEVSNFDCWPKHMARKLPNTQIINYAMSGSSLLYSLYALDQYNQKNYNKDRYTIFNCTTPFRFDYIPEGLKLDDFLVDTEITNYKELDIKKLTYSISSFRYKNFLFGNAKKPKEQRQFGKLLVKFFNSQMESIQYKACCTYAEDEADFTWYQREFGANEDKFCVERDYGKKWYKKYSPDNSHFNSAGLEILADKILNLTNLYKIV